MNQFKAVYERQSSSLRFSEASYDQNKPRTLSTTKSSMIWPARSKCKMQGS